MSVCMCIAQDRPHLMPVLSRQPIVLRNTGCCSEDHFDRYGRRHQFSWRQPGRRQWLTPYVYSYRTQEAQLKPDCRTEGRRIGCQTTSAYSFLYFFFILYIYLSIYIISLLNAYSHFSCIPSLLLLIFQIHKLLHGWGARHVFAHCVCLVMYGYKHEATQIPNLQTI